MEETKYYENGEYAVKATIPVTEETKESNVKLYSKIGDGFVDVSEIPAKELVSTISEIGGNGHTIDEARFNEVTNS